MNGAFFDEMCKISAPRWQREVARGSVSLADLGADTAVAVRRKLQSVPRSVVPAAEADRRARIKTKALVAALPGQGVDAHALGRNTKARTYPPTGLTPPIIGVGEGAGPLLRVRQELGGLGDKEKVVRSLRRSRPGDDVLQHATWRHELGEAKDLVRAARGEQVAEHSGHKGLTPLLEEHMASLPSPRAVRTHQAVRASSDEADRFTAKKLREAGMGVGGGVVLPEGRTAGKIEAAIRKRFPVEASTEQAPQRYIST